MNKQNIKSSQGVIILYQLKLQSLIIRFLFLLTRVGLMLIRVDSCWFGWLVSYSCWFVLTRVGLALIHFVLVLIRVDSRWFASDSCWFVLIRVDLCWHSCIKTDLISIYNAKNMKQREKLVDHFDGRETKTRKLIVNLS